MKKKPEKNPCDKSNRVNVQRSGEFGNRARRSRTKGKKTTKQLKAPMDGNKIDSYENHFENEWVKIRQKKEQEKLHIHIFLFLKLNNPFSFIEWIIAFKFYVLFIVTKKKGNNFVEMNKIWTTNPYTHWSKQYKKVNHRFQRPW